MKDELDRLYSHHSACKAELGELVCIANKWRIRAYVAEKLLGYMNSLNAFWRPEDMKKEIEIHTERLYGKWYRREPWVEDEELSWTKIKKGANL